MIETGKHQDYLYYDLPLRLYVDGLWAATNKTALEAEYETVIYYELVRYKEHESNETIKEYRVRIRRA